MVGALPPQNRKIMTTQLKRFLSSCHQDDFITLNKAKSRTAKRYLKNNDRDGHYKYDDMYNGTDVHVCLLVLSDPSLEI